jgi:uncharacterized protein (DUF2147 family)
MRSQLLFTAFLSIAATAALAAAPSATVFGDWQTTTNSIVRVAPCAPGHAANSTICLTIVRLAPTAPETTDQQNPDAALRNRNLCGLTVGTGFHEADPEHLTDGHLYDPKTGHTYQGAISAEGNTLHLRGYIGISLFGRTETWHRVPTIRACR